MSISRTGMVCTQLVSGALLQLASHGESDPSYPWENDRFGTRNLLKKSIQGSVGQFCSTPVEGSVSSSAAGCPEGKLTTFWKFPGWGCREIRQQRISFCIFCVGLGDSHSERKTDCQSWMPRSWPGPLMTCQPPSTMAHPLCHSSLPQTWRNSWSTPSRRIMPK